ncbi:RNA pseudouridylate synthase domain-containing protein 4 isoform X3 [Enhydra lutris kenyoni]|uniref:Pseudouridylate synthase RPUSD4, mitochondrial n=1 Tax=Enhydra lutris kenyoni TaxID=391180 RepID=A0A2Y9KBM4_ENHLU|nr:RNA pseudouridylate synthase domain-containing protein 4 isoform X3 [Enhydra lutris kenyoni]
MSAQRLAEKLRAQKQEQKTKQPPVPTSPVQRRVQELVRFTKQLQRVHPNVLAKALSRGIVHQDKDLVVINKPYGLPVHGGPGVRLCISDVLPILAKMLHGHKAEPLHLCHRLDKETTGVMVLAWEKEVAHQVQELFRTRQVAKKYWTITVRVPVPPAGVVDIPVIEKEVQGQQRHYKVGELSSPGAWLFCSSLQLCLDFFWCQMTLSPGFRMEDGKMVRARSNRKAHTAVTQYQVLSSTLSAALVELQPITEAVSWYPEEAGPAPGEGPPHPPSPARAPADPAGPGVQEGGAQLGLRASSLLLPLPATLGPTDAKSGSEWGRRSRT